MNSKWIVVCCYNGEFDPLQTFDTEQEAYQYMKRDYDAMFEAYPEHDADAGNELLEDSAWFEDVECLSYWQIYEVKFENQGGNQDG